MLQRQLLTLVSLTLATASTAHAVSSPTWVQDNTWSGQQQAGNSSENSGENSGRRNTARTNARGREITPFSPGSHNISVDVGQIFLMGDLTTKYSDNIGWRLRYTYGVSDIFAFDAGIGYSEHSAGKFSMATGNLGLRTNLTWFDKVIPYIVFGLGFYRPAYEQAVAGDPNNMQSVAPFLFGIHVGPGVTLQLSRLFFFGTAITFHNMFGVNRSAQDGGPGNVGGAFTTFLLHAGVSL